MTDDSAAVEDANRRETGFAMGFGAKILPVDLDLDRIPKLLAEVRRYSELDAPLEKRDGCKDCERVRTLTELLAD